MVLKYTEYINESIISDKIERLKDLTKDLEDNDFTVEFKNFGSCDFIINHESGKTTNIHLKDILPYKPIFKSNYPTINKIHFISFIIYKLKNDELVKFDEKESGMLDSFKKLLSSYEILGPNSRGEKYCVFFIKKEKLYKSII